MLSRESRCCKLSQQAPGARLIAASAHEDSETSVPTVRADCGTSASDASDGAFGTSRCQWVASSCRGLLGELNAHRELGLGLRWIGILEHADTATRPGCRRAQLDPGSAAIVDIRK
jgi:hypothetical protein